MRKLFAVGILVAGMVLVVGCWGCNDNPTAVGVESQSATPVRFGIAHLATASTFDCARPQAIDARASWIEVPWKFVEPQPGQWNFAVLDAGIDAAQRCGVDLGIKLFASRDFWGVQPGGQAKGSRPPRDIEAYAAWVRAVVERYRGRVRAYALENEVIAPAFWDADYEAYLSLWQRGYEAIKAADPEAIVVDFGMTSQSYGVAVARWRYEHGDLAGAMAWLNRYFVRRDPLHVTNENELKAALLTPEAQRIYDVMLDHFAHPTLYDAYQLHFYEPWDLLSDIFDWVRARMAEHGGVKPIEVWEIGYAWHDDPSYDPQRHGLDTAKLLVTALGEGASRVYYLPYASTRARNGRLETVRALVDAQGEPRPAFFSYRATVAQLRVFAIFPSFRR